MKLCTLLKPLAISSVALFGVTTAIRAQADGGFPLVRDGSAATIWVAKTDWEVAKISAGDLAEDVELVSGQKPEVVNDFSSLRGPVVLIGTLGRSAQIDHLVAEGKLDVKEVAGKWETFQISVVRNPGDRLDQALVVAGSDRRGTAFGVYELSRRIGVSPWVWWADVTPERREVLSVSAAPIVEGPPAVKYRGIFINDEMWGLRPWAEGTFAPEEGRGIGPKTHARIFELMLRLRANYLWPAMHLHTVPFNCYEKNREVADDYAIVMGSSHIEPMLRNNMPHAEWDREGGGDWNYLTNRDKIYDYWERRIIENGKYENIYTMGMRGKDDEPMEGGDTKEEKITTLERIFRDQRKILSDHVNENLVKVPQVFIPYTEVLHLYDAGMKVPDDITICWPEDNFGYICRLPNDRERGRPGGSGIYYHIQWINGATTAYPWLNTMPPALIQTEMTKAWEYGARRLWILNVGDIKPGEIGMEFFLDMAWDPESFIGGDVRDWLVKWAERDLDPRFAGEIADILMEYYQLGFIRRPEFMLQKKVDQPYEFSWFSHPHAGDEAGRRLRRYHAIASATKALYQKIPNERKAAFYQLVYYPVLGSALMNDKIIQADKSLRAGALGHSAAGGHADQAREAAAGILFLDEWYNRKLTGVGAKWRYMMTSTAGPWGHQRHQFEMPPLSDYAGVGPPELALVLEGGHPENLSDLSCYTRRPRFIDLCNKGKGEIRWSSKVSHPWLKLGPASGSFSVGERILVNVDWDSIPAGASEAELTITSDAGEATVRVPVFHPEGPARDRVKGFVESHGCIAMEAEHFARKVDQRGAGWTVVNGLGRCGDSVIVMPTTTVGGSDPESIREKSPSLEYDMHVFSQGTFELHLDCLPTYPVSPEFGTRLAVSIDGGDPEIVNESIPNGWERKLANIRRWRTTVTIENPGKHKLTVWLVDPGVILDRVVLHTREPVESYLGPEESFHR